MTPQRIISQDELATIERGLFDRLHAPANPEALTDVLDFSTRKLREVLASHRELLKVRTKI